MGEYQTKFTGQGRIILPKKFRQKLEGGKVILSRGFEGCIWGFSISGWEKEAGKQLEVSATEKEARDLRRYLFSAAEEVELDSQGRFIIPKTLISFAGLEDEVVLAGTGDHFEIWNPVSWEKLVKRFTKSFKKAV